MFEFNSIPLFDGSPQEAIQIIFSRIGDKKKGYVCVVSVHGVVEACQHKTMTRIFRNALLNIPDGMPLVFLGRLLGHKTMMRLYGPTMTLRICEQAEKEKKRVFLYGTTDDTLHRLKSNLKDRYPNLRVVGSFAPPFTTQSNDAIQRDMAIIQAKKPQIIFVGLSTPKQETWMYEHYDMFSGCVCVGVGAAFDFIAGTKQQAPHWMQATGFEWMFRLAKEPRRLWKRYMMNIILFPYCILVSLFGKRTEKE